MNQTRITLHVLAESRIEAFHQALRAILNLSHADGTCSSASSEGASYRADIETITVPDDDETEPPFGPHIPHPVTAAEAGL